MSFKYFLQPIIPKWVLRLYHRAYAIVTPIFFGNPGKQLTIIGVTGTNGKSTTVIMIGHMLMAAGKRVAWMSTATERIGTQEKLNNRKMTMPGHGDLQRFLRRALQAGCTHAIVEVSSQGVSQYRDLGIPFDVGVFLNLTPEHIEAHGSFGLYRDAKLNFFRHLASRRLQKFGKLQDRAIVINIDDPEGPRFFSVHVEKNFAFSRSGKAFPKFDEIISPKNIEDTKKGKINFTINDIRFSLPAFGLFNLDNALAAIAALRSVGLSFEEMSHGLKNFPGVPGRLEFIQKSPFSVMVDYAPEPASLAALYSVVHELEHRRIIHVFGSAGGGRDVARRAVMGMYVAERADVAIVTNEDPYDENPETIIQQIADGARQAKKLVDGDTLMTITDRREAIRAALKMAEEGDLVLVTGKACEQWIMGPRGKKTPWDDRKIIKEELLKT